MGSVVKKTPEERACVRQLRKAMSDIYRLMDFDELDAHRLFTSLQEMQLIVNGVLSTCSTGHTCKDLD